MNNPVTLLEGAWQMVRAEWEGEGAPELVAARTVLEIAAGTYVVRFDGQVADRGTLQPGHPDAPGTLLWLGVEGPNAGRAIPGRYQQVGDRLRICYGLGGELPAGFTTAPGQARYLATYRRIAGGTPSLAGGQGPQASAR